MHVKPEAVSVLSATCYLKKLLQVAGFSFILKEGMNRRKKLPGNIEKMVNILFHSVTITSPLLTSSETSTKLCQAHAKVSKNKPPEKLYLLCHTIEIL